MQEEQGHFPQPERGAGTPTGHSMLEIECRQLIVNAVHCTITSKEYNFASRVQWMNMLPSIGQALEENQEPVFGGIIHLFLVGEALVREHTVVDDDRQLRCLNKSFWGELRGKYLHF